LPIKKKICLLGAEAVGKTSLARRFVHGIYSERYLTTARVKIDKKIVRIAEQEILLVVWDLAGEDELVQLRTEYLRGASGYLLVVDGTRISTLRKAVELERKAVEAIGSVPFVLVINKSDLRDEWFPIEEHLEECGCRPWRLCTTSALLGSGVEEAFSLLARLMLANQAGSARETACS
jgi:small GTP-binding protein